MAQSSLSLQSKVGPMRVALNGYAQNQDFLKQLHITPLDSGRYDVYVQLRDTNVSLQRPIRITGAGVHTYLISRNYRGTIQLRYRGTELPLPSPMVTQAMQSAVRWPLPEAAEALAGNSAPPTTKSTSTPVKIKAQAQPKLEPIDYTAREVDTIIPFEAKAKQRDTARPDALASEEPQRAAAATPPAFPQKDSLRATGSAAEKSPIYRKEDSLTAKKEGETKSQPGKPTSPAVALKDTLRQTPPPDQKPAEEKAVAERAKTTDEDEVAWQTFLSGLEARQFEFEKQQYIQQEFREQWGEEDKMVALLKLLKYDQSKLEFMREQAALIKTLQNPEALLQTLQYEISKNKAQNILHE